MSPVRVRSLAPLSQRLTHSARAPESRPRCGVSRRGHVNVGVLAQISVICGQQQRPQVLQPRQQSLAGRDGPTAVAYSFFEFHDARLMDGNYLVKGRHQRWPGLADQPRAAPELEPHRAIRTGIEGMPGDLASGRLGLDTRCGIFCGEVRQLLEGCGDLEKLQPQRDIIRLFRISSELRGPPPVVRDMRRVVHFGPHVGGGRVDCRLSYKRVLAYSEGSFCDRRLSSWRASGRIGSSLWRGSGASPAHGRGAPRGARITR